jgi:sterol desaturase/sphingolipid hydroxylase (fatty acid hydroxylase superfamily)
LLQWLAHWTGHVFITPAIHSVHHSCIRPEHDSNYGAGLVLWDKLLGTFMAPWADRPARYGVAGFDGP